MSIKFTFTHALLLVTALPLTACTSSIGLEEEHIGTAQQLKMTNNGLTTNGLTTNGLTTNGVTTTAMPLYGLSLNGLMNNANVPSHLPEQYSAEILDHLTSCALPSGEDHNFSITINGSPVTLHGGLALAPQWEYDTGHCDADCMTWVSGCMVARLNFYGQVVALSARGHGMATSSAEILQYETPEGVYWGDIFNKPENSPLKMFACRIGGSSLVERVCGPEDPQNPGWPDCPVKIMPHDCSEYCSGPDATDGHYENCQDPNNSAITYPGSITIYRDIN